MLSKQKYMNSFNNQRQDRKQNIRRKKPKFMVETYNSDSGIA